MRPSRKWSENQHGRPLSAWAGAAIFKQLAPSVRLTWYALHAFLNGNLVGEASFAAIGVHAHLDRRTVIDAVRALEDAKLIERVHTRNFWGGWGPNQYRMLPPPGVADRKELVISDQARKLAGDFHVALGRPGHAPEPGELLFAEELVQRFGEGGDRAVGLGLVAAKGWRPKVLGGLRRYIPSDLPVLQEVHEGNSSGLDRAMEQEIADRALRDAADRAVAEAAEAALADLRRRLPALVLEGQALLGELEGLAAESTQHLSVTLRVGRQMTLKAAVGALASWLERPEADQAERVLAAARKARDRFRN